MKSLVNKANFIDKLARCRKLDPELVWQNDEEDLLELLFKEQVVLVPRPWSTEPLCLITKQSVKRIQFVLKEEVTQLNSAALSVSNVSPPVVCRSFLELCKEPNHND